MEAIASKAYPEESDYAGRKINWCGMEKADNGYIVKWSEKQTMPKGSMEHAEYIDHKKLYSDEEKDTAWDMYKEVKMAEMEYEQHRRY